MESESSPASTLARAESRSRAGASDGSRPSDLIAELAGRGVQRFVYTPVEVDGLMEGPGIEGLRAVAATASETGADLVYSGGIGSLDDLREVVNLGLQSLSGVIVGRALYEGRFTVAEGQATLEG